MANSRRPHIQYLESLRPHDYYLDGPRVEEPEEPEEPSPTSDYGQESEYKGICSAILRQDDPHTAPDYSYAFSSGSTPSAWPSDFTAGTYRGRVYTKVRRHGATSESKDMASESDSITTVDGSSHRESSKNQSEERYSLELERRTIANGLRTNMLSGNQGSNRG